MLHWITIIIGIIFMSLSISNPFYKIIIKKRINTNLLFDICIRTLLLLLSIIFIFLGLYLESKN